MERAPMAVFPSNDIISLVGKAPRFDLAESTGPDLTLGELLGEEGEGLAAIRLGYGSAAGNDELRSVIAEVHGAAADDVVITAAFTLCDPGDEAIVARPAFPMPASALEAVKARVLTLPLTFDQGYQPDLDAFRRLLSPRTRLVCLASPQNPSGVAIARDRLREMALVMAEHAPRACLVVDETYREAAYGSDAAAPSVLASQLGAVSVSSLSKCHGAPGLRIGWAIVRDASLRDQLVRAKFNTVISCPPLSEALALMVLRQQGRIVAQRRERLAENLRLTRCWVERRAQFVQWVRPDAGALCCVRLRPGVFSDADVARCHDAMAQQGVRVARGEWFGDEPRVFRLGFGLLDAAPLQEALDRLALALRSVARRPT
jgi:aspartate/methionine/tyrosine aminotransferase